MPVQVSVKKKNLLFNKVHLETKEKVPKAKGKTHVIAHFVTRADKLHQRKLHLWLLFLSLQLGKNLKNMTCTFNKVNKEQSEPMRSSHISQLVCYIIIRCWDPFCFWDSRSVARRSIFGRVQDSFQALAFCASTGP